MRSAVFLRVALLGLLIAGLLGQVGAATQQIVLKEYLNQRYVNELVSYPFAADQGQCTAKSVQLAGPKGPQAAQLSEIEYWPNTQFVKSARISFIVDALEPLTTNTYTVVNGGKALTLTDLQVNPGNASVQISTSHLDIRLLFGEQTFTEPTPAQQVPGPVTMLQLAGGEWAGGSRLYGDTAVKSWSAKLTDQGPVFARVEFLYTFANGNTLKLAAVVAAGDSAVRWEMAVKDDQPAQGVELLLPPVPGLKQVQCLKGYGSWSKEHALPVTPSTDKPIFLLCPDSSIAGSFPDSPPYARLSGDGGREVQLRARDAGAWVDPVKPLTYGGYKTWDLEMIPKSWDAWQRKRVPVMYAEDGEITMKCNLAAGRRKWSISTGAPLVGEKLDVVKDYVLDWPKNPQEQHPHLFMSKAEMEEGLKRLPADPARIQWCIAVKGYWGWATEGYLRSGGDKNVAAQTDTPQHLRDTMALLGNYDTMRNGNAVAALYDAIIDTDLVTPQERVLYRSQLAALGYALADPALWSMERGYHSGNPNMSVSYTLALGVVACLISDHPMAKQWADYATAWTDKWLTDEVGPNGEWLPEGSHYSQVSMTPIVAYAVAAKRAGFHDFINDPRLKKMILYFAKQFTPRDPQRNNKRVTAPVGRGTSGDTNGMFGVMARATADSDPEYSKVMQWAWAESGYPTEVGDWRMGGFEPLYMNRQLPMKAPAWGSELFPELGVVLRDGVGTPGENYLNIKSNVNSLRNLDIWTPEVGGIAKWYSRGRPVSEAFTFAVGYFERHELLRDGVLLAHNYDGAGNGKEPFGYYTTTTFGAFAALPRLDYIRATYTVTNPDTRGWFPDNMPAWPKVTAATEAKLTWTRQALFMKDDEPLGPHYLLLRDTVAGGQPTEWQFWSLSEKIGTPAEMKDAAAVLKDKPGTVIQPARALPQGNRYTAVGQFDVDLEYYIASPTATPRHTLRYGGKRDALEYQDLLHLQLPGDGDYFVAIFPRFRTEEAPAFSTLGNGKIIKVTGAFGTDYGLLSTEPVNVSADGITFQGTAAAVQRRATGLVLLLSAAGEVREKEYGLSAQQSASLRVKTDSLTVNLPADHAHGQVTVQAPAGWVLDKSTAGVKLTVTKRTQYQLSVPAGVATVTLVKGR
ncbi:MAG: hypothetical protein ACYDBB_25760 [Armatimonadota bacterium]